jgi:hypothetical protein
MATAREIISALREVGKVWVVGQEIKTDLPQGTLTPKRIEAIKVNKEAIINLLQAEQKGPVQGLPRGGCGSTSYTRITDGFTHPAGGTVDGRHCGGKDCHVKLMLSVPPKTEAPPVVRTDLPNWCRADCLGLEDHGHGPGCVHPHTGTWSPLHSLLECTAEALLANLPGKVALPEFCKGNRCDNYHQADGGVHWCCNDTSSTVWRRWRVNSMDHCPDAGCPKEVDHVQE